MSSNWQETRKQLDSVLTVERKMAAARRQRVWETRKQQFSQMSALFVAEIRLFLAGRIGSTP
jgi:hypothetical protein